MLNDNAKKWLKALRSGDYTQGKGYLCRNGNYCCLGVACDLAVKEGVLSEPSKEGDYLIFGGDNDRNVSILPKVVTDWLGLKNNEGLFVTKGSYNKLWTLNDHSNRTFEQIADFIESEPEELFLTEM